MAINTMVLCSLVVVVIWSGWSGVWALLYERSECIYFQNGFACISGTRFLRSWYELVRACTAKDDSAAFHSSPDGVYAADILGRGCNVRVSGGRGKKTWMDEVQEDSEAGRRSRDIEVTHRLSWALCRGLDDDEEEARECQIVEIVVEVADSTTHTDK